MNEPPTSSPRAAAKRTGSRARADQRDEPVAEQNRPRQKAAGTPRLLFSCGLLLWLLSPCVAIAADERGQIHPRELRCEALVNPLGVGEPVPQLSWIGVSSRRSERQTAYQVLVATDARVLSHDEGDLWNSGKVPSDESIHIAYAGKPLASRLECHWKVRTWDRDGQASPWSETSHWAVGLLTPDDWHARWIDASHPVTANNKAVTITRATYAGADGEGARDVTGWVAGLLSKGDESLLVENSTLGLDPIYGKPKR